MSYYRTDKQLEYVARLGAAIVGATLGLTGSFFGVLALVNGEAVGVSGRLPLYVLALAVSFVAVVLLLEAESRSGESVLATATALSVGTFAFVSLASEGLVFAVRYPDRLFSSQLLAYVFSAGLIATALGFWFANHRDELNFRRSSSGNGRGSLSESLSNRSGSRSRSRTRSDGGRDRL